MLPNSALICKIIIILPPLKEYFKTQAQGVLYSRAVKGGFIFALFSPEDIVIFLYFSRIYTKTLIIIQFGAKSSLKLQTSMV